MSKTEINFDLGSRSLTEAETAVVENAKARLRDSLERHRKDIAARLLFASPKAKAAAKPKVKKAAAKPSSETPTQGSASWTSNKVAPAIRKY